jgi:hypothetical protein
VIVWPLVTITGPPQLPPPLTVTVKLQLDVLPAASVAVDITVVLPTGKTEPDAGLLTAVALEQLSLAVTVKLTTAPEPELALTVMLAGQLIAGAVLSMTVIVCVALAVRPTASVAVKVRVITSGLAAEPAPPLVDCETVTFAVPQLSEAVACDGEAGGTLLAH